MGPACLRYARPMILRPVARLLAFTALLLVFLAAPARADELADARGVIGKQLELIKKGDVAALKAGFTKRLQDRITKDKVVAAQKEAARYTVDDLVASVAGEKGALKIKMKNGRTLTTLVKTDGKWLADTIWFQ